MKRPAPAPADPTGGDAFESLRGHVALVTGAGSERGIGRAVACGLARAGATVVCFDRNAGGARNTAALIRDAGSPALAVTGDASLRRDVRDALRRTEEAFGPVTVLVNNAAIATLKPFLKLTDAEWDRMIAVNLTGYFLFCQEAARVMIARRIRGSIINVSSISATVAGEWKVGYCASKGGIPVLTRGLALELGAHGIRVNCVSPGAIATDIVRNARFKAALARVPVGDRTPLRRLGAGADVVGAAVFLASSAAEFITGADLLVDGGLTAGQRLPPGLRR
jgi:NAD(P)-dependent dehydrogenase (short-subunit alcohol dehydrogenase family)